MATNLELYEALKRKLDEETARMLVEALPKGEDLVTKTYLDARLSQLETRIMGCSRSSRVSCSGSPR